MTNVEREPARLPPPQDKLLPFFAYGSLKVGEPAHDQISGLLARDPVPATIRGVLWIRDGLPLLEVGGEDRVQGFLLEFKREDAELAYDTICRFEPRAHYFWNDGAELLEPEARANILIGKKLGKGRAVRLETNSWTVLDDPVFGPGLSVIGNAIVSDAAQSFASAPPDHFEWPRFFRLQMVYLLLWSAIERYASLQAGPGLDPMAKIKKFGGHEAFGAALKRVGVRERSICDSRDPEEVIPLKSSDPSSAILYYYQVRNNLSHRGKGAWADGEIVRESLVELKAIFDAVLETARARSPRKP